MAWVYKQTAEKCFHCFTFPWYEGKEPINFDTEEEANKFCSETNEANEKAIQEAKSWKKP